MLNLTGFIWAPHSLEAHECLIDPISRLHHAAHTIRLAAMEHFSGADAERLENLAACIEDNAADLQGIHDAAVEAASERTPIADAHDWRRKSYAEMAL